MAIHPYVPKEVKPGEPVTAQGWNEIVKAVLAITQYLETSEATSLKVKVTNAEADPLRTRVTAVRDDGLIAEAVAPVAPGGDFMFGALKPGSYTVRASAPGLDEASAPVTIPSSATVSLTMKASAVKMPSVFGLELPAALATLKTAQINVARVVDVAGRDVAPANPGVEYSKAPVLVQLPSAGEYVAPSMTAQIVVAAPLVAEAAVEMPSLVGLTQAEAQKALENIGLVLGKVVVKQPKQS
ncbi:MAG: carboxypeptidase regulatory-like domain-containing protein [Desulfobacterales bacterium]|jgi:hypothetical protein|nr:carboxypeptidase regulatory-like domain-containing protein [Desulfobacterales bacterium]